MYYWSINSRYNTQGGGYDQWCMLKERSAHAGTCYSHSCQRPPPLTHTHTWKYILPHHAAYRRNRVLSLWAMATLHLNFEHDISPLLEQSQTWASNCVGHPNPSGGFHGDQRDVTVWSQNSRPAGSNSDCGIGCMWLWLLRKCGAVTLTNKVDSSDGYNVVLYENIMDSYILYINMINCVFLRDKQRW